MCQKACLRVLLISFWNFFFKCGFEILTCVITFITYTFFILNDHCCLFLILILQFFCFVPVSSCFWLVCIVSNRTFYYNFIMPIIYHQIYFLLCLDTLVCPFILNICGHTRCFKFLIRLLDDAPTATAKFPYVCDVFFNKSHLTPNYAIRAVKVGYVARRWRQRDEGLQRRAPDASEGG